jgi:hypothetical protein
MASASRAFGNNWQIILSTARSGTPTSSQHNDLLPQHQDLGFQRRARSEQIDDNPKNYSAEIQHPAEDHPILRLTPAGWNLRQGQASGTWLRMTHSTVAIH